jgi:1,2-diacylglycerol 3-alpha-glucosyltransferase
MRIFFVTNNYTPYSGGVTQSIIAITDALRTQGHEVFIVTLDFEPKAKSAPSTELRINSALPCPPKLSAKDGATADKATADPEYVIRVPCPIKFMYKKNYMAIPWRPTYFITQLLRQYKPDIVHVHHPFLLGVSGLRAARACDIPCVFTYHTMYEDYAHYVPLPLCLTKKLISSAVRRFCNGVDGIIAPSNTIKEYLTNQQIKTPRLHQGFCGQAITVIPSPLRTIFLTKSEQSARPEPVEGYLRAPKDKFFRLLVVSRFVPEKNIPFVFDVFKQLPNNFTLTLVGYGSDYQRMQKLAFDTLQLPPERIHFIHKPPLEDLLHCYRNADIFIFSSQTDTQGIVLAEAMSQGLPVIAINGPGQRDIVKNGYNGFIIENAQDAVTKIINITQDVPLFNKLISGAYTTSQRYHAHIITQKLLDFYHIIRS